MHYYQVGDLQIREVSANELETLKNLVNLNQNTQSSELQKHFDQMRLTHFKIIQILDWHHIIEEYNDFKTSQHGQLYKLSKNFMQNPDEFIQELKTSSPVVEY